MSESRSNNSFAPLLAVPTNATAGNDRIASPLRRLKAGSCLACSSRPVLLLAIVSDFSSGLSRIYLPQASARKRARARKRLAPPLAGRHAAVGLLFLRGAGMPVVPEREGVARRDDENSPRAA